MKKSAALLVVSIVLGCFPLFAEEPVRDEAAKLAAVLNDPNASFFTKGLACREATQRGAEASVAPLAAVLLDKKLSHLARTGLQQIPGPAATKALCDALPAANENIAIGIIGTLGRRRDPAAVTSLVPLLNVPKAPVVRAAAIALGTIGNDAALEALRKAFAENDLSRKPLYVDGLFACAERLAGSGNPAAAATVYASVRAVRKLPIPMRRGAIRGELRSLNPSTGSPEKAKTIVVLDTEMLDPDSGNFYAVIEAVRDLNAPALTPVLLAFLPKLDASRQILLLDLLDCRGDSAATQAVLEKATSEQVESVRMAAIKALAGHPAPETVSFLLETAAGGNEAFAACAADALSRMQTEGLEARIVERLKQTKGKACIPLVDVCSQRKMAEATPALLPLLNDPEYHVRLATLKALGNTVSGETIDVLIDRLMNPASKIEFDTVNGSLQTVCHRTVDPDAVAGKLAARYDGAPVETKVVLLGLYGALGGKAAIDAVRKALADPAEAIQDRASQVLGNWPDPDAASVLLELLKNPDVRKFHNRALRGYIRIVRQMDTSNERRFDMCMQALALAERDEEKLLLVDALGRINILKSLEKLTEFFETPAFSDQAFRSAISVGRAIQTQQREMTAKAMQRIIELSPDADLKRQATEILEATKKN